MNSKEVVKTIMDKKQISNKELATLIDDKAENLWHRLNEHKTKELGVIKLSEVLNALGYKVLITQSNTRVCSDEYEIN